MKQLCIRPSGDSTELIGTSEIAKQTHAKAIHKHSDAPLVDSFLPETKPTRRKQPKLPSRVPPILSASDFCKKRREARSVHNR